ncbi:MAG: hypothetical protein U1A27_00460 [Phycisphaerae bacterium]
MKFVRKAAVRMVVAGLLLGTPAAVMAAQSDQSGQTSGDTGGTCSGWRCRLMNLLFDAATQFVESGGCTVQQQTTG